MGAAAGPVPRASEARTEAVVVSTADRLIKLAPAPSQYRAGLKLPLAVIGDAVIGRYPPSRPSLVHVRPCRHRSRRRDDPGGAPMMRVMFPPCQRRTLVEDC